jgi:gliding motility-associated-like protein
LNKNTFCLLVILGILVSPFIGFAQNTISSSGRVSGDVVELFQKRLKTQRVFQTVKQITGASKEEMKMFHQFYLDSLMHDKSAYCQAVLHHKIKNDLDIKNYADRKTPEYVAMFRRFQKLRKDAPATVDEYMHRSSPPVTCVTGCNNLDFENGSLSAWTACYAANTSTSSSFSSSTFTCFGPLGAVTQSAYDPSTSSYQVSLTSGAGNDPIAGALIPLVAPGGGSYSCEVGDGTGTDYGVAMIEQTWMVTNAQPNFTYMDAVVLENPAHPYYFQPYFEIELLDQNGNPIPGCGQYAVVSAPGNPYFTPIYYPTDADTVYCKPWTNQYVSLTSYVGTCVTLKVISSDCGYGAHFGYGYFDALCTPQSVISSSPAICGSTNVILTAPPGSASYDWIGPCIVGSTTNQSATVNCAGTYSVVLISNINNPCPDTLKTTITVSPLLNFNAVSQTNVKCFGGNTGSATNIASGGTPPYTYSWSPTNGTNATATGLSAGTYTAYATDNAGCKDSIVITITQPPLLTATASSTPVTCAANTGTLSVNVTGGTPAYAYLWAPIGNTNANVTGLSAGTYTITVTDANGCTATSTTTITTSGSLSVTTTTTGVLCNGGSTGTATATPAGGTAPYTYTWTPLGGNTATATGLSAGTYTISVTDANGCSGTAIATITQPLAINLVTSATQTPCGGNTGTTSVTATGGTPGYVYLWAPSGNTNSTATGLTAGVYTVTVTDANGCTQTSAAVVTTTGGLTVTTVVTGISCNGGSNGSATATPAGGTAPYTYTWLPSGGSNATATGLNLGTYTISVEDANGCLGTASATITQPTALTATSSATQTNCGVSTGSATVTPAGGTPGYNYIWTPSGKTTATATGLSAGIYTVTITDANGCTQTSSASVTSLNGETVTISAFTNITCNGANNGSITTTLAGGTAPFTYAWTPTGGTSSSATGLSAATYTVTVTDANGCIAFATQTITEPPLLTAAITSTTNISCPGPNTGTLIMAAGGGTPGYNYNWAPAGGNTPTATGLSAGTYTVTVTDANGCTATAGGTITVTSASPLIVSVSGSSSFCPGGSASLSVNASGGNGTYNFLWTPGNNTQQNITVTPSSTTVYTVTVMDACGDVVNNDVTVTVNAAPNVSFRTDPSEGCAPLCVQFRDLSTLSSGNISQWRWNFGDGDSSSGKEPIHCYQKPGIFNVDLTVTSDSGCSSTLKILNMINVYSSPSAGFTYSPQPITILYPVVQFTDNSSSPYPIVYWNWSFGDGADSTSILRNPSHQYSDTGTYCATLVVTDEHGCTDSTTNCLVVDPMFTLYIPDAFSPNGDGLNDVFMAKGSYIKDFEMYVFDRWGMELFHSTDINKGWNGSVKNGSTVSQEDTYVYQINVTDTKGNKHAYSGKVTLLK